MSAFKFDKYSVRFAKKYIPCFKDQMPVMFVSYSRPYTTSLSSSWPNDTCDALPHTTGTSDIFILSKQNKCLASM